jgi:hypothetical protein
MGRKIMPRTHKAHAGAKGRLAATAAVILGVGILLNAGVAPAQQAKEQGTRFRASALLAGQSLSGPNYRIADSVTNDGFMNRYTVTVDGKAYPVDGNALMRIRLAELKALEKMVRVKKTDVYKKALKTAATGPLSAAKGMLTQPIDTVKGAASGVGKFFGNIGHAMFGGASEQEEGVFKTTIGFATAKRNFAYKFGIDPYTTFPPVKEVLEEIAWAGAGGGLTVSAAFMGIPGVGGGVVRGTKTTDAMNRLVRDKSPAELKEINAKKLRQMRVDASVAELFLEHPKFSPTHKTHLVNALGFVGVYDRQLFIERAILVQDETMAFFMQRWAEMIAAYHIKVKPLARFYRLGRMPIAQRADGTLIAPLPLDHLQWTEQVAARHAANMRDIRTIPGVTGGEIWIEGTISQAARKVLEGQNWVVKENAGETLKLN